MRDTREGRTVSKRHNDAPTLIKSLSNGDVWSAKRQWRGNLAEKSKVPRKVKPSWWDFKGGCLSFNSFQAQTRTRTRHSLSPSLSLSLCLCTSVIRAIYMRRELYRVYRLELPFNDFVMETESVGRHLGDRCERVPPSFPQRGIFLDKYMPETVTRFFLLLAYFLDL